MVPGPVRAARGAAAHAQRQGRPPRPAGAGPVALAAAREYVAPRNPKEEVLAAVWAEVLGLERVGVHDDFFELGGDSLLVIQVVTKANKAGMGITTKQVFQHRTVAELAAVAGTSDILAEQGPVTGEVRFTPAQLHFLERHHPNPYFHTLGNLLRPRDRKLDRQALRGRCSRSSTTTTTCARGWSAATVGGRVEAGLRPAAPGLPPARIDVSLVPPDVRGRVLRDALIDLIRSQDMEAGHLVKHASSSSWVEQGVRLLPRHPVHGRGHRLVDGPAGRPRHGLPPALHRRAHVAAAQDHLGAPVGGPAGGAAPTACLPRSGPTGSSASPGRRSRCRATSPAGATLGLAAAAPLRHGRRGEPAAAAAGAARLRRADRRHPDDGPHARLRALDGPARHGLPDGRQRQGAALGRRGPDPHRGLVQHHLPRAARPGPDAGRRSKRCGRSTSSSAASRTAVSATAFCAT